MCSDSYTSGAYAYLGHPIYVGMGVAVVGAALVYGNALVVLVAGLVILRFWWAPRVENQLLIRQFGEQAERR
ncbi:MAG: methyltransferase family protein [Candidatus Acidiferrales bacterium]